MVNSLAPCVRVCACVCVCGILVITAGSLPEYSCLLISRSKQPCQPDYHWTPVNWQFTPSCLFRLLTREQSCREGQWPRCTALSGMESLVRARGHGSAVSSVLIGVLLKTSGNAGSHTLRPISLQPWACHLLVVRISPGLALMAVKLPVLYKVLQHAASSPGGKACAFLPAPVLHLMLPRADKSVGEAREVGEGRMGGDRMRWGGGAGQRVGRLSPGMVSSDVAVDLLSPFPDPTP